MTEVLRGVAVSPGVAVAEPWVYQAAVGGDDLIGLSEAAHRAAEQLEALADRLRSGGRGDEAGILEAQALMAEDPELLEAADSAVRAGRRASDAVLAAGEQMAALLSSIDDEVLSARSADVRDVAGRIARLIRGEAPPALERRSVVVAIDLPPSVTAELDAELLAGIALEAGSRTAHAAILARALGIPAVVGVAGLLAAAADARVIGLDGRSGEVTIDPDAVALEQLESAAAVQRQRESADAQLHATPLATADGHRVMLGANIGRPEEASAAAEAGAEGIGLFRTEFLFMGRSAAPSVAEQVRAYTAAMAPFAGRPFVLRTLDIGGDKQLPYVRQDREDNPFLGVRAIRLAAANRPLLVDQLRAVIEAAERSEAEVWIMAPMVADLDDVALVRALVAEADGSSAAMKIGIMIELPSAVVIADQLAREVDFFSIGTNDLTQYLLAADRTNAALSPRQDPMHPAVLRSIRTVIEAGHGAGIPVAVCGEMARDLPSALVLTGLGIDELSMDPRSFGAVKRALAGATLEHARRTALQALDAPSADAARRLATEALG